MITPREDFLNIFGKVKREDSKYVPLNERVLEELTAKEKAILGKVVKEDPDPEPKKDKEEKPEKEPKKDKEDKPEKDKKEPPPEKKGDKEPKKSEAPNKPAKDYTIDKFMEDGKAAEASLDSQSVDPEQLTMGVEVEMKEHTKDEVVAKKIAMDHLAEIPDYYTRLAAMEKDALKGEELPPEGGLSLEPEGGGLPPPSPEGEESMGELSSAGETSF